MTLQLTNLSAQTTWQTQIAAFPYSGFHHAAMSMMQSIAHDQTVMLAHNQHGCLPFIRRPWQSYYDICNPYGYTGILGEAHFLDDLCDFFANEACLALYSLQHPVLTSFMDTHPDCHYAHTAYVIDLTQTRATLERGLSQNHQRNIRRCQQAGGQIIMDKSILLDAFVRHYQAFVQSIDARSVYHFNEASLRFIAQADCCDLIGIAIDDVIVAVLSFLRGSHGVEFFLQGAAPTGRAYARLILWEALCHYQRLGFTYLNLGGGIQDNDSLADFKRQFGGEAKACYAIKKIIHQGAYQAACQGAILSDYFPAYRASRV